jgi:hypothetical protein
MICDQGIQLRSALSKPLDVVEKRFKPVVKVAVPWRSRQVGAKPEKFINEAEA